MRIKVHQGPSETEKLRKRVERAKETYGKRIPE